MRSYQFDQELLALKNKTIPQHIKEQYCNFVTHCNFSRFVFQICRLNSRDLKRYHE